MTRERRVGKRKTLYRRNARCEWFVVAQKQEVLTSRSPFARRLSSISSARASLRNRATNNDLEIHALQMTVLNWLTITYSHHAQVVPGGILYKTMILGFLACAVAIALLVTLKRTTVTIFLNSICRAKINFVPLHRVNSV